MRARLFESLFSALGVAVVALPLVTVGCGGGATARTAARTPATRPVTDPSPPPVDTAAIVTAVAKARGLAPKRPITFAVVDDEEFSATFGAEIAHRRQVRGITSLSVSGGSDASFYLAYYDTRLKKVLLRKKTPEWAKLTDARGLVAHEVEHAIQDQYFDLDSLLSSPEVDVARAQHALIEGDAEATSAGAVAILDGLPPKRAIVNGTTIVEGLGIDTYVAGGMVDPRMAKLKPAEREEMLFPYRHGAAFVGALVRTGGFALVDRAFTHPPTSSAEILHPEAYLAGRVRVEVAKIVDPPGWTSSGPKGTFGELALRNVLLSLGFPEDRAHAVASAWRGDSFAALKDAQGHTAYAWTIVVDDEANATTLAAVFSQRGKTLWRGRVLSWVDGLPDDVARPMLSSLLGLAPERTPAPVPPFGAITIPPLPPRLMDRIPHVATLSEGALRAPELGLDLRVPPGWIQRPASDKQGVVAVVGGASGAVVFSIDGTRQSPMVLHAMAGGVISGFKQGGPPVQRTDEMVATPLGDAFDLHVVFAGGGHLRFVAAPLCAGESTLMITAFSRTPSPEFDEEVVRLIGQLDPKRTMASTWCAGIHQERTTDL
jgi:hypothetical protein